ncbi:MAG: prepilin-type N-terminal cleavage/methylation domain-containing protein [Candidatus Paceibacterota bacterium]|jgi:prepilin-type N-terminal cleavage/methylation domain-containing protein
MKKQIEGFTLIELLVTIAIISILASFVLSSFSSAKQRAYQSRALAEFKSMATALELYYGDYGQYPPDASRNIPSGLENYLATSGGDRWPDAPWPGSIYDWENWVDPDDSTKKIYQISVRFCPAGGPLEACVFPNLSWADGFDIDSSMYYCLEGACRSHVNQSVSYPGYCVNCGQN